MGVPRSWSSLVAYLLASQQTLQSDIVAIAPAFEHDDPPFSGRRKHNLYSGTSRGLYDKLLPSEYVRIRSCVELDRSYPELHHEQGIVFLAIVLPRCMRRPDDIHT